jgi:thioester reductase-like protein
MSASVDLLITGATGFVGRFVLRHILETETPTPSIAVIVRSSGKRSAQQRWQEEMVASSLLAEYADKASKVKVIDAALENLEQTTLHISSARRIIHCAANVRHYDPFETLKRDNVENVQKVLQLAATLRAESLVLLSTCYVHPQTTEVGKRAPARVVGNPVPSDFYNDYCYTKWLGEEAVFDAAGMVKSMPANIQILRLSCVGAPLRWDLAAHPCAAQAHLGIASLALRGYLEVLAAQPTSRISVIPVDVAAAAIVRASHSTSATSPRIQQICPAPSQIDYHISLQSMFGTLGGQTGFRGIVSSDTTGVHLPWWKQLLYRLSEKGRKSLMLHEHVQEFTSTFSDGDIRFESSLEDADFSMGKRSDIRTSIAEQLAADTLAYGVRILHERQLVRGVPMSLSDRFWHRLANREPVQACWTLGEPISVEEWPTYRGRLWAFFSSYRKYNAVINERYEWEQNRRLGLDAYIGPPAALEEGETTATGQEERIAQILGSGLRSAKPEFLWHVQPILGGAGNAQITHMLLRFDHGLTDGAGALGTAPEFDRCVFEGEATPIQPQDFRKPRSMPFWMDLWVGLVYVATLAMLYFFPAISTGSPTAYSREASVSAATFDTAALRPPSADGSAAPTFTSELLWTLTHRLTRLTGDHEHVFGVPAVGSIFRNQAELPTNDFVPILLPVSSRDSRSSFEFKCLFLRAKSVRFISWCLMRLLEWGQFDGVRDRMLSRVRCLVSSLQMGKSVPSLLTNHVITTTPAPIPFGVVAITAGDQTFLTVRSHIATMPAEKIAEAFRLSQVPGSSSSGEKNETEPKPITDHAISMDE